MKIKMNLVNVLLFLLLIGLCISLCACSKPELEMLADPQNIKAENRVITWDPVENATGYLVFFDGKEYQLENNRFTYQDIKEPGTYKFSVIALGDDQSYSDSVIVHQNITVESPIEHGFDEQGFEYTFIAELGGYEIGAGTADLSGMVELPDCYCDWPVKQLEFRMFKHPDAWTHYTCRPKWYTGAYCNIITTGIKLPAYLEIIGRFSLAFILNLEEIEIPDTVVKLGESAFEGCKRLKKVNISPNVKEIPYACFRDTALSEIILPPALEKIGNEAFATRSIDYWIYDGDQKHLIAQVNSDVTEVTIPASVKSIGQYVFAGRQKLETVTVIENVTEGIGAFCFEDTAWLASKPDGFVYLKDYLYCYKGELPENAKVEIPSGTKGICPGAFRYQKNLREVVLPEGIEYWGGGIFDYCTSLSSVSLPSDMKTVPDGMFCYCTNLKTVTLPEGLLCIDGYAFSESGLESITIPDSVKDVGSSFADCQSLKEITFPSGVENLGVCFLEGCTALETVFIPASVKKIEGYPFYSCDSLTHVFYEGTSFDEFLKKYKRMDDELLTLLKNTPFYFYSEEKPTEEGNYWHYVDGVPTPWETEE